MASLKKNSEFIGGDVSPWALPKEFFVQNFVVAFRDANMGTFFLNSVIVTATALILDVYKRQLWNCGGRVKRCF